jgi:hypothetical protein
MHARAPAPWRRLPAKQLLLQVAGGTAVALRVTLTLPARGAGAPGRPAAAGGRPRRGAAGAGDGRRAGGRRRRARGHLPAARARGAPRRLGRALPGAAGAARAQPARGAGVSRRRPASAARARSGLRSAHGRARPALPVAPAGSWSGRCGQCMRGACIARSREPCAWVGNGRCVCITRRPAESLACACGACAGPACRLCSYPAEPLKLQLKPESFQALLHATGRQGQICGCAVTSVAQRPFVCESATRLSATCLPSSLACRCARFSMHMPCTFPALRAACSLRTVGCLSFGGGRGCGARALHCRRGARLLSPRFVTCGTQRVLERAACLQLLPRRAGLRMQI